MRYGSIRYVNNLPVDHALVTNHVSRPDGLTILEGTPNALNEALAAGTVDVAAISAAALLDQPQVEILPEACIASHGPVESVLLVSRRHPEELDAGIIHCTHQSATGSLLLRILLERDVGVQAELAPKAFADPWRALEGSDPSQQGVRPDAVLTIGDDALHAVRSLEAQKPDEAIHVLDLGEAWRAYVGLPMVYAVWAARSGPTGPDRGAVDAFRGALVASKRWGRAHPEALLDAACARTGHDRARLATYFGRLHHDLGDTERAGLVRFLEEARLVLGDASTPAMAQELLPVLEATH